MTLHYITSLNITYKRTYNAYVQTRIQYFALHVISLHRKDVYVTVSYNTLHTYITFKHTLHNITKHHKPSQRTTYMQTSHTYMHAYIHSSHTKLITGITFTRTLHTYIHYIHIITHALALQSISSHTFSAQ